MQMKQDAQSLEDQLSPEQKKVWENIKQGFVELKLIEEGKLKARPIQELFDELDDDDDDEEEDAYLIAAMEEVKDEEPISEEEAIEFRNWLKESIESQKQNPQ